VIKEKIRVQFISLLMNKKNWKGEIFIYINPQSPLKQETLWVVSKFMK